MPKTIMTDIRNDERINEINESLRLIEKKNGLVFGTDAYLLAACLPKREKYAAAELGCGTGVVSLLAVARKKCRHVYAFEVQNEFCDLTERNVRLNGFENEITVINKNVRDALPSDTKKEVDVVFTNSPASEYSSVYSVTVYVSIVTGIKSTVQSSSHAEPLNGESDVYLTPRSLVSRVMVEFGGISPLTGSTPPHLVLKE